MNKLTYEQKLELYRKGRYIVRVPPAQIIGWSDEVWSDEVWIAYIDTNGTWECQ